MSCLGGLYPLHILLNEGLLRLLLRRTCIELVLEWHRYLFLFLESGRV